MKRNRMEHEKKIDTANHYDCLETDVREDARENFSRQPYKSVDMAKYIAKQVARIGNSVVAVMAQKLVEANCPYLKIGERIPNLRIDDSQEQLKFA